MPSVLAILATLLGAGATLLMLVLLLAGSPNSSPQQLVQIKAMMIGVGVVGLIGLVGGVWATIAGRPGLGAILGLAPAAACAALFIFLLVSGG